MTDTAEPQVIYPPERSPKVPCCECGGTGQRPKPPPGQRWAMPECLRCHGAGELDRKHYAYCKRRECVGCLPTVAEIDQWPNLLAVFAEMLARCIPQSPERKTHEGAVAAIRENAAEYELVAHFARKATFAEQDCERLQALVNEHHNVRHWLDGNEPQRKVGLVLWGTPCAVCTSAGVGGVEP